MDRYKAHELNIKANELLKNSGFEYAFYGGFAIELFLNRTIRKHGDVDVKKFDHLPFTVCFMEKEIIDE